MLSQEDKAKLLEIARQTISDLVTKKTAPRFSIQSPVLKELRGVFVTIHKKGELRGCIGYIEPIKPLWEAVRDMAIASAVRDPRFEPVTKDELPLLEIEISVLSPFKKISSIDEIEVGKHGLYIEKQGFSGLLLPQVATEYGWDKKTFLEHTCLKAGLPSNAWKSGAEIYTFEADVFS